MNYQDLIISAVIPRTPADQHEANKSLQFIIDSKITSKIFDDKYKFLFDVAVQCYFKKVHLDKDIFEIYVQNEGLLTQEEKDEFRIMFSAIKESVVPFEKLKTIFPIFLEQRQAIEYGETLTNAARILNEGLTVDKRLQKGIKDSRKYLIKNVTELSTLDAGIYPQGTLKEGTDSFWKNYLEKESNPNTGCLTGTKEIDDLTKGIQKGELWLVAAYSGEGKSSIIRNWAYNMAINQHKNVVFATLEMPYRQVYRKFISLHSTNPKFNKLGVPDRNLKHGNMSNDQKSYIHDIVLPDLMHSPDYGAIHVMQLPHDETVTSFREKLTYLSTAFPIDCVFLDYASIMKSEHRWPTKQQLIEEIMIGLKQLALDFNEGEGIPIISPHQVPREKRDKAAQSKGKRYDIGFLADSASTERTADFVAWLLRTEEMIQSKEIKMGLHKYRDDELIPDFMLSESFEFGKIESMLNRGTSGLLFSGNKTAAPQAPISFDDIFKS